jgi:hypothetical protein
MHTKDCILTVVAASLLCAHQGIRAQSTSDRYPINVDGKFGFIDGRGRSVITPRYSGVGVAGFHEGVAAVAQDGKWGYINADGSEVVALKYQAVGPFSEGLALALDGEGHLFVIDHQWQANSFECIPPPVSNPFVFVDVPPPFSEGLTEYTLSQVTNNTVSQETVYVDRNCNKVITRAGSGGGFSEGLAAICENEKCGYIDHDGNVVIPFKHKEAGRFFDGLAIVKFGDNWGYIDRSGKFAIQPQFELGLGEFHEGLAVIVTEGKVGYIDKAGRIVIPAKYEAAYDFSEGLAMVVNPLRKIVVAGHIENDGGLDIVFVDHSGKRVIKTALEQTLGNGNGFSEGLAEVMYQGRDTYIDHNGEPVWQH